MTIIINRLNGSPLLSYLQLHLCIQYLYQVLIFQRLDYQISGKNRLPVTLMNFIGPTVLPHKKGFFDHDRCMISVTGNFPSPSFRGPTTPQITASSQETPHISGRYTHHQYEVLLMPSPVSAGKNRCAVIMQSNPALFVTRRSIDVSVFVRIAWALSDINRDQKLGTVDSTADTTAIAFGGR